MAASNTRGEGAVENATRKAAEAARKAANKEQDVKSGVLRNGYGRRSV